MAKLGSILFKLRSTTCGERKFSCTNLPIDSAIRALFRGIISVWSFKNFGIGIFPKGFLNNTVIAYQSAKPPTTPASAPNMSM